MVVMEGEVILLVVIEEEVVILTVMEVVHTCTLPGKIARTNSDPSVSSGPTTGTVLHN